MKILFAIATIPFLAACQTTVTSASAHQSHHHRAQKAPVVVYQNHNRRNKAPARVLKPVEVCDYIDEPVYGILDRPTSGNEVLLGAIIGGVIGKKTMKSDGGAVVGALIGGSLTDGQRVQERTVVGTNRVYKCEIVYK